MKAFKRFWLRNLRRVRDQVDDVQEDIQESSLFWRLIFLVAVVYLLVTLATGIYWSRTPDLFPVRQNAQALLAAEQFTESPAIGVTTTATLITLTESLWQKPGGYTLNDLTPPGVWLDDMPNWEYGVIIQVRDMAKALREAFSRSQSQSREDEDLQKAESRLNYYQDSWLIPSTEAQYQEGVGYLHAYLARLQRGDADAHFYARADNLVYWLRTVETRLGNLSQRLSASVGQEEVGLTGESEIAGATGGLKYKTRWNQLDDVFYEARGSCWALIHLLKAVEIDFAPVIADKNAQVSVKQIIRELESTQQTLYSPVILNGSGFGFLANHSLVMASYISRANAALIDLRRLLEQG